MNIKILTIISCLMFVISCSTAQDNKQSDRDKKMVELWNSSDNFTTSSGINVKKVKKSNSEWEEVLTDKAYYVIRQKGTERAFTSELLKNNKNGIYTCGACGMPLFHSETKYKSGSGWPSFYKPIEDAFILRDTDYNLGYARTEVMCMRCQGHLGHVFNDGPEPTGLRYCINGVSLDFEEGKSYSEIISQINLTNKDN